MTSGDDIVICGASRTPMGGFQGVFTGVKSTTLGTEAVKAAMERSGAKPDQIERIFMGCVLPAGLGQAPARQAALNAGLALSTEATTVNKMCGSGMQAAILAHDTLKAGSAEVIVAGGMESMTGAPYLLPTARNGQRIGHGITVDHMYMDGLEDAYSPGKLMGAFAEDTAKAYGFSREDQDAFAIESLTRAQKAIENGDFKAEITPVEVVGRKETIVVDTDEQPQKGRPDKIPHLRPAFAKDGTITAANASSISDGASAFVMARHSTAEKMGLNAQARIVAHGAHAQKPGLFTTAPVPAMKRVLDQAGWSVGDVDLWEVNEAFAVVAMAAMKELAIPHNKLNIHGGACALGHPIGASGARIMTTLIHALKANGLKRGVASLCIGGGEATAVALEVL